jgi:filamentous hemagglutinin family protein
MNKVYRLIWSTITNAFVVVAENVRGRGKRSGTVGGASPTMSGIARPTFGSAFQLKTLFITLALIGTNAFAAPAPNALPTGGQVSAGQATISQSAAAMTINQTSQRTAINWNTFNIGAAAQVKFVQPNASSVALNRVVTSDPSAIYGKLSANGQVFLLNPNGVLFGAGSRVDVGGLVASTMKLSDADFMAGNYRLSKDGNGSILNQGTLTARDSGYIALLAPTVENDGILTANLGTVALAAGDAVTLNMGGDSLISIKVEQASVDTLVRNKQLIQADGGQIYLTASAAQTLSNQAVAVAAHVAGQMITVNGVTRLVSAVVENTGIVQARTALNAAGQNQTGHIILLANMANGTMNVGGTLDASAPASPVGAQFIARNDSNPSPDKSASHNGGFIETSAAHVHIADNVKVTTAAAQGKSGTWLIDPTNFAISAGSGAQTTSGIGATTLQTALGSGNVSITTSATANGTDLGDIIIDTPLAWSANTLSLSAHRHVLVNSVVGVSGTGGLNVTTNTSAATDTDSTSAGYLKMKQTRVGTTGPDEFTGKINWSSSASPTIEGTVYTVLNDKTTINAALQGTLAGNFALGSDMAAIGAWTPVGTADSNGQRFTGKLDGLGHTLSGLTVATTAVEGRGVFAFVGDAMRLANIGLVDSTITGGGTGEIGGFIGTITSPTTAVNISNVFTGSGTSVVNSRTDGPSHFGGLVGFANGKLTLKDSYNAASVYSQGNGTIAQVGGLVGLSIGANPVFKNLYNTGTIIGGTDANKLIPTNLGYSIGGIIGEARFSTTNPTIADLKNYGAVYGDQRVGGVIGFLQVAANSITVSPTRLANSGAIKGRTQIGGIVGWSTTNNDSVTVQYSYLTNSGTLTGTSQGVGGLIGYVEGNWSLGSGVQNNSTTINSSFNTGAVIANDGAGGLIGATGGNVESKVTLTDFYNTGAISATASANGFVGGIIGQANLAIVVMNRGYNAGTVTSATASNVAGILVGRYENNVSTALSATSTYGLNGVVPGDKAIGLSNVTGNTTGTVTNHTQLADAATFQAQTLATDGFAASGKWGGGGGTLPYLLGFTVPVTINITSGLSSIYGNTAPSGAETGFTLSGCTSCITLNYAGFITATTAAGSYGYAANPTLLPITYSSGTAGDYAVSWGTNSSYTVSPRPINITANSSQTKVYGAANPTYTYTAETSSAGRGLVNSDTFSGALARAAGEFVDTYAINVNTLANSNYTITVVPANFAITPAPLTVTATAQSKVYGDALTLGNTTTLFTSSGLQNGEDIGRVTLASAGAVDTAGVSGSPYSIVPSVATLGTFMASNYSITYVNGALTVNRAPLTIQAQPQTKNYGTTLNLGTTTYMPSGLQNGESIGGVTLTSGGAVDTAARGTYNIVPSAATGGTFDSNNYTITYSTGVNALTVNRAPLTVTASNDSKTYDGAAYPGGNGVTYSGFVLGQDASVLTGTLAYGGTAQGATNYSASTYAIEPFGYSTGGNYSFTYVPSTLTIAQRPITLTADAQTKVYGNADPSLTYAMEAAGTGRGRVGTDTFTGSLSRTAGETVAGGPYAIAQGTVANSNYAISFTGANLAITQRPITLTASAATKVYGENDPSLAVTVTSGSLATVAQSDSLANVSGTLSRQTGENVGAYDIALGTGGTAGTKAANYAITFTTDNNAVSITRRPVTVTADAKSKTYGDTDPALTYTNTTGTAGTGVGLLSGDSLSGSLTRVAGDTSGAGGVTYQIQQGTITNTANGNYNITYVPANLTIGQKTLTLAGSTGVTKTYSGTTAMAAGTNGYGSLVGLESGDTVTVSGSPVFNSANVNAASAVQIGGVVIAGADAGNYTLSWSNGTGSITPAPLTFTANADAKFVTQADAGAYNGVSYSGFLNGETTAVLGLGGLAVTRSATGPDGNTGGVNTLAGTYTGALTPSGATANNSNYTISYATGSYTIVPAGQLLVTVQNTSTTYGTAAGYTIGSAKYLDGSNVIQTLAAPTQSGNTFTYADGAGGTAVFTLGPQSPQTSTASQLKAGNYAVGASSITESSGNFSNNLVVVGSLAVNQKALTATATGVSKTYNGNTSMNGVTLGLTGLETNDVVSVSGNGAFAQKNAGTSLVYSISSVTLGSTDAANYYLNGGSSLTGANGVITAANLSVTGITVGNKVYNATTAATLGGTAAIAALGADVLTLGGTGSGVFNNKNVGTGKAVTVSGYTLGGTDAGNYTLVQ